MVLELFLGSIGLCIVIVWVFILSFQLQLLFPFKMLCWLTIKANGLVEGVSEEMFSVESRTCEVSASGDSKTCEVSGWKWFLEAMLDESLSLCSVESRIFKSSSSKWLFDSRFLFLFFHSTRQPQQRKPAMNAKIIEDWVKNRRVLSEKYLSVTNCFSV